MQMHYRSAKQPVWARKRTEGDDVQDVRRATSLRVLQTIIRTLDLGISIYQHQAECNAGGKELVEATFEKLFSK